MKNTNVDEHIWLIRKAATQIFSCDLLLWSCWECSKYVVVMLAGFLKTTPEEIIVGNFFRLLLWIHVQVFYYVRKLWDIFCSSSSWLLKNVNQTSTSFNEKLRKAGRFSSQDEVFIWKILFRLCRISPWTSWIPPDRNEMKYVPVSCKCNKYIKKWL